MTPVLAHAGHWITTALYLAPVAAVLAWLGWNEWRARRRGG